MHLLSPDTLEGFLRHYSYAAVFGIIALESAGLPLPGETTLISAAIYAATTHVLSLPLILAWASAGAIVGDSIGFWVGSRFGPTLLLRYGRHIGLDEPSLKLGQYLFGRFGGRVIFFGRFIAVLRALAAVLAGANRYPWRKFIVFNAAGGIVWATLYGSAAYCLGQSMHRIAGPFAVAILVLALIAVTLAGRFLKQHKDRLQAEANLAIPGRLGGITVSPESRASAAAAGLEGAVRRGDG